MAAEEAETIAALLDEGVSYVHIRKPDRDAAMVAKLIKQIPKHYHRQLVIHYHHQLVEMFPDCRLHHSMKHPIETSSEQRTSRSCHTLEEVVECGCKHSYVFLSPIFNSISKQDYKAGFDHDDLKQLLNNQSTIEHTKVIALGGISIHTASTAKQLGFLGIALLGSVWVVNDKSVSKDETMKQYKEIAKAWNH